DVLLHRPSRYEDRSRISAVAELAPGQAALVVVRIEAAEIRFGRRRSLLVSTTDGAARLWLRFFHFGPQQQARLSRGVWVRLYGEPRPGQYGPEMVHPETHVVKDEAEGRAIVPSFVPVYPATAGVSQGRLRDMVSQALTHLDTPGFWPEALPEDGSCPGSPMSARQAIRQLHDPAIGPDLRQLAEGEDPATHRLAFEELLGHQL